VRAFPSGEGPWQVSTEGGDEPQWRPDGTELFYVSPARRMMAAAVESGGAVFRSSPPSSGSACGPPASFRSGATTSCEPTASVSSLTSSWRTRRGVRSPWSSTGRCGCRDDPPASRSCAPCLVQAISILSRPWALLRRQLPGSDLPRGIGHTRASARQRLVTAWSRNTGTYRASPWCPQGADRPGFSTLRGGRCCCSILRAFRNQPVVSSILTAGSRFLSATATTLLRDQGCAVSPRRLGGTGERGGSHQPAPLALKNPVRRVRLTRRRQSRGGEDETRTSVVRRSRW
jgi:hypothetical protein